MKDTHAPEGTQYDLAVIGAGSAGFSAAITAAEAGARVAMIGAGTIGGTCVNFGCVPSKALIRAVESVHQARAAARFDGIAGQARITDWAATVAQKQALVEELRGAKYADVLPRHETVGYIEGRARFDDSGKLTVDGRPFAAAKVILATGSRPHVPAIPGIEEVATLDSAAALEVSELPASMIVLGAGFIGVELAQLFARAGVAVTLVSRRGVLPEAEPEVSVALSDTLADEGIRLVRAKGYVQVAQEGSDVALQLAGGEMLKAERLVLATGRVPNSDGLNLAAAGIAVDARGGIEVDAHMRTANPNVWAAGDVTGRDQFVYMAAYGAKIAARNAVAGEARRYDNATMPWV
ncbi:hypothetical protein LCGC14_2060780, partial [marine sediment metagenome]